MIITIAVCIAFVLLAALNAAFSQSPNDFVLREDHDVFFPPVLKGEGFYRSLLINVAFLGIATVTSGFQFGTSTHFYISGSAMLAIVVNLAWGFLGGLCLRPDSRQIIERRRVIWVGTLVAVSILLFIFSVATIYHSAAESGTPSTSQTTPIRTENEQMAKRKAKTAEQPKTTAQQLGSLIKSARDIMRKDKGLNGDLDRLPC